jgi:hypothetical protein
MARNSSGTMSAPGSYPPIADAIISLDDYKALVQDILNELSDSLSRSGKGGMIEALKLADGTQGLPGLSFNGDATSGLYRSAGEVRLAVLGALIAKFKAEGVDVTGALTASGAVTAGAGVSGTTGTFSAGLADDASHGNRGGGALHSDATTGVAGFLSAADKVKLDGATTAAYVDSLRPLAASVNSDGTVAWARGFSTSDTGGSGTYTLAFSSAMPDTNYAVATSSDGGEVIVNTKTVNGFSVLTTNSAGSIAAHAFDVIVTR